MELTVALGDPLYDPGSPPNLNGMAGFRDIREEGPEDQEEGEEASTLGGSHGAGFGEPP